MSENTSNPELTPEQLLQRQETLMREYNARQEVLRLAELAVEEKMLEIAQELGATFQHTGSCRDFPNAEVLQIRVRFNKKKQRDVPFFVPLPGLPVTWLGGHRKPKVEQPVEAAPVQETVQLAPQVEEPAPVVNQEPGLDIIE